MVIQILHCMFNMAHTEAFGRQKRSKYQPKWRFSILKNNSISQISFIIDKEVKAALVRACWFYLPEMSGELSVQYGHQSWRFWPAQFITFFHLLIICYKLLILLCIVLLLSDPFTMLTRNAKAFMNSTGKAADSSSTEFVSLAILRERYSRSRSGYLRTRLSRSCPP